MLRQARSKLQRRGAPGKILQQGIQLALELRVLTRHLVGVLKLLQWRDERFRNVTPSVRAEASSRVRPGLYSGGHLFPFQFEPCSARPARGTGMCWNSDATLKCGATKCYSRADSTAANRARKRAGSFLPGRASTPLATSTA